MKTILEDNISYETKIKDFGVDPVNKRIITTGDKLIFFKEGKIEKEVAGKIKNCEVIRYIKEKNQLFISSIFFVSTPRTNISSSITHIFIISFLKIFCIACILNVSSVIIKSPVPVPIK